MPEFSPPVLKSSIEYFAMSVGIGQNLMLPIWELMREIIYLLVYDLRPLGPARPGSRRLMILKCYSPGRTGIRSTSGN